MAETIRKVAYFTMDVADRAGTAAAALTALAREKVNLLAFTGFPNGKRSQLDFIPKNAAAFNRAAKKANLRVKGKKVGFLLQGADRPGAVGKVLTKLSEAGINCTAIDAVSAGKGVFGAILWVKAADVGRAAKALGAK
jgi:hypothetical protein